MSRQGEFIKQIKGKPLSLLRRRAQVKETTETHFADFKRCKEKWAIHDDDVYNFDEVGTQIRVMGREMVIVPADYDAVYIDDLDKKELVTLTKCILASGYHVPPMVTFKGAYHLRKYFDNDLSGDILWTRSPSGFVNNRLTLKWIEHFDKYTRERTKGAYRMLVFDGYGSHDTDAFLDYC